MFLFVFACAHSSLINSKNVQSIAQETVTVAHPSATLIRSEMVATSNSKKGGRYVDIRMSYKPLLQEEADLTVRYYIQSTDPCKINLEVLSDTGTIPPIFLNEWAAEPHLSQYICSNS